jgi:hypothetical protein
MLHRLYVVEVALGICKEVECKFVPAEEASTITRNPDGSVLTMPTTSGVLALSGTITN